MIRMWCTPLLLVRRDWEFFENRNVYRVWRRSTGRYIGKLFAELLPTGLTKAEFDQWLYIADHIVDLRVAARRRRRNK